MFRKLLKALGCVWLFCGFLIAASVDRVPDPPAIQGHGEVSHSHIVVGAEFQPACAGNDPYSALPSESDSTGFLIIPEPTFTQKLLACASNASDNSPPLL